MAKRTNNNTTPAKEVLAIKNIENIQYEII